MTEFTRSSAQCANVSRLGFCNVVFRKLYECPYVRVDGWVLQGYVKWNIYHHWDTLVSVRTFIVI